MEKHAGTTDEHLIELMLEQQLITESQAQRVRQTLRRGQTLSDALWHTPLVDPVKFASLQAYAAHEEERSSSREVRKLSSSGAHKLPDFQPLRGEDDDLDIALDLDLDPPPDSSPVDGYELKSLGPVGSAAAGEEGAEGGSGPVELPDLDLDLDLDGAPPGSEPTPEPTVPPPEEEPEIEIPDPRPRPGAPPSSQPAAASADGNRPPSLAELRRRASGDTPPPADPLAKAEDLQGELDSALDEAFTTSPAEDGASPTPKQRPAGGSLGEPGPAEDYLPRGRKLQTYDLAEDEGISLIHQANELLQESLGAGDSALRIYSGGVEGPNIVRYARDRSEREAAERPAEEVEKLANRLKVMGRLEAWRRQHTQKGSFLVRWERKECRVLLDFDPGGPASGEVLTAYFLRGGEGA